MTVKPAPAPDAVTAAYWRRLSEGRLAFQRCAACRAAWLPASPVCPRCWSSATAMEDCCGRARLVTWATYHRAYHAAFADELPYVVGLVELAEGPRLLAGVRCADPESLRSGAPLTLVLQPREGGFNVPAFRSERGGEEDAHGD